MYSKGNLAIALLLTGFVAAIFGSRLRSEERPPAERTKTQHVAPWADDEPLPLFSDEIKVFMRAKLEHSQNLLKGLTLEDYDTITEEAQELSLLSQATLWQVLQTEDYVQHSREFRRAADDIKAAAEKKNLDGAALAYVDMTMSCVRCDKYVRGVKTADLGLPHKARTAR